LAQQAADATTITRVLVIGGVVTAVELENEYDIVILKFLDITVI
jgi:predicted DNA-binding ribbon-helix-helix protein